MTNHVETRQWPFRLDELSKGGVVAAEEIERITGVRRGDARRYQLAIMRAQDLLQRQWRRERMEEVTTRIDGDTIVICTDDDAVGVNEQRADQGMGTIRRAVRRGAAVDVSNLTPDNRNRLERFLVRGGAWLAGAKNAARVALRAHERQTPGLNATPWNRK